MRGRPPETEPASDLASALVSVASPLERAAEHCDALAHADQAVATAVAVGYGDAVVLDRELDRVVAVTEQDACLRVGAVRARVRERFLRDSVDREVDAERQRARYPPSIRNSTGSPAGRPAKLCRPA